MAHDSLGKKTHLACVLQIYQNSHRIWEDELLDLNDAWRKLRDNPTIAHTFSKLGWPFDTRSQQAYVHRFFGWLGLPADQQAIYPTKVLATGDSIQLRQCLWIDFLFGTPEGGRAINGLYNALVSSGGGPLEVSPRTHNEFCGWLGIPISDNTRRGPFARWLENIGLATPKPGRGGNETSVIVDMCGTRYSTPEAITYSLIREFADPFDGGGLRKVRIEKNKISSSQTVCALLLPMEDIPSKIKECVRQKYMSEKGKFLEIDPNSFFHALQLNGPFPSQSWFDETLDITMPMNREALDAIIEFPEDDCTAMDSDPFVDTAELETVERRLRDNAFRQRVAAAYSYQCAATGFRFRSVSKRSWYGDAAHIVPHSGKDKLGNKVYGSSSISNGIFIQRFVHWCFDRGWLTFEPVIKKKGKIDGYVCRVATVGVDSFFEKESKVILEYEGKEITPENLPANASQWPSLRALQWHRENVFDG